MAEVKNSGSIREALFCCEQLMGIQESSVNSDNAATRFELECCRNLVRFMLADWHGRGRSLIHICCGTGDMLESFWERGFEVIGFEPNEYLRAKAASACHPCIEIQGGSEERLPFDDKYFDYGVFTISGTCSSEALREVCRVSKKGVLLLGQNAFSLYGLFSSHSPVKGTAGNWRKSCSLIHSLQPGCRTMMRSTLFFAPSTQELSEGSRRHAMILPLPFGAYMAVRFDFAPMPASPSSPLRISDFFRKENGAAAMQYSQPTSKRGDE